MLTEQQLKMKILNLGCGQYPMPNALNVDRIQYAKADVDLDIEDTSRMMEILPRNHYEKIHMHHVLEHLTDPFRTMMACGDLLAPGGILEIRVPHVSRGFTHAEHKHGFDVSFPHYFNPNLPTFYYGPTLDLVSLRLDWAIRFDIYEMVIPKWQTSIVKILNSVITPLANLSPGLCSRLWCYWVGGFEQIEFVFRKR